MARPRFLDLLTRERRAELEPQLRAEVQAGRSLAELLAWCQARDIKVGQSALADFRREVLGGASEDAAARVQRQVVGAGAAGPPLPPAAAPAAPPAPCPAFDPAAAGELDHRQLLLAELARAQATAQSEQNSNARNAASRLVLDISEQLRELEREGRGAQRPQVVFFFPEVTRIEHLESDEA